MPDPEKLAALGRTTLAAELDDTEKATLSEVLTQRDLEEGEVLVREGTSDSHLYAVVRGSLAVVKHAGTPHEVTFNTLAPGDLAGEMAFLDGLERYASLRWRAATRASSASIGRGWRGCRSGRVY